MSGELDVEKLRAFMVELDRRLDSQILQVKKALAEVRSLKPKEERREEDDHGTD